MTACSVASPRNQDRLHSHAFRTRDFPLQTHTMLYVNQRFQSSLSLYFFSSTVSFKTITNKSIFPQDTSHKIPFSPHYNVLPSFVFPTHPHVHCLFCPPTLFLPFARNPVFAAYILFTFLLLIIQICDA